MKHLVDHQTPPAARHFWSALSISLLIAIPSSAVWAHECGASKWSIEKDNFVSYTINGYQHVPSYKILEKGDLLVAKIEPPVDINNPNLVFKITGTGNGTTMFNIYWQGKRQQKNCPVKITVSG